MTEPTPKAAAVQAGFARVEGYLTALSARLADGLDRRKAQLALVAAFIARQDQMLADLRQQFPAPVNPADTPNGPLSGRELAVLRLAAAGYSGKETARRLGVGAKSVETFKARGLKKLGIRSRVALVRHAVRCGWLVGTAEPPAAGEMRAGKS